MALFLFGSDLASTAAAVSKATDIEREIRPTARLVAPTSSHTDSCSTIVALAVKSGGNDTLPTTLPTAPLRSDPTRSASGDVDLQSQPTPSPAPVRAPGRYQILSEHGRGGLGRVSRAYDCELGRDVAIKELISRGPVNEVRFLREAMITARLEHPGIVPVHEAGRWSDGTPGISVFLAHAEAAGLAGGCGALDFLEGGLAEISTDDVSLGLWTGVAGIRLTISQLVAGDDATALLAHLDRAVQERLDGPVIGNYDLYSGLAGILLAYAADDICGDRVVTQVLIASSTLTCVILAITNLGVPMV